MYLSIYLSLVIPSSDSMTTIAKNRYDVKTLPPFVRLLRNLAGRCKMTCRWLNMGQYGNRK